MSNTISRAQFLRGDFNNRHAPVRPPWSLSESLFTDVCTQCNQCIGNCPEKIIIHGEAGYPVIDFTRGECTFCTLCTTSCNHNAFTQPANSSPWNLKAEINKHCLAFSNIHCLVCKEQCVSEAISFSHRAGAVPYPYLSINLCNGCGACKATCPANAIDFYYDDNSEQLKNHQEKLA